MAPIFVFSSFCINTGQRHNKAVSQSIVQLSPPTPPLPNCLGSAKCAFCSCGGMERSGCPTHWVLLIIWNQRISNYLSCPNNFPRWEILGNISVVSMTALGSHREGEGRLRKWELWLTYEKKKKEGLGPVMTCTATRVTSLSIHRYCDWKARSTDVAELNLSFCSHLHCKFSCFLKHATGWVV